jgi:hypothetical protein
MEKIYGKGKKENKKKLSNCYFPGDLVRPKTSLSYRCARVLNDRKMDILTAQ